MKGAPIAWRPGTGWLGRRALPVIEALVGVFLPADVRLDGIDRAEVARRIAAKVAMMPGFLSLAMVILVSVFDGYALVRGGGFFASLPLQRRERIAAEWKRAPFAACGDFILFYDRLAMFVAYSLAEGLAQEREET